MAKFVVVDGCTAGWIGVFEDAVGLKYQIYPTFAGLVSAHDDDALILVDIPIGLPSRDSPRECDSLARQMLGSRACTVFTPPARPTLDANSYAQALELNRAELDRGISRQAFAIRDKIREVDELLRGEPALQRRVLEMHPEIAFLALNGGQPVFHGKKKAAGYAHRLELLLHEESRAQALIEQVMDETPRREVHRDDVVDALVGLTRARNGKDDLAWLAGGQHIDSAGLPMRIHY